MQWPRMGMKGGKSVERFRHSRQTLSGCGCGPKIACCPEDCGYIVERVLSSQTHTCCFDGMLTVCGLPARLCPPLTLCGVSVLEVKPCERAELHGGCCPPCGAGSRVALVLCCQVKDQCGKCAEGASQIEVEVPPVCREGRRGGCLRRGAEVELVSARFCAPCAFAVCAHICIQTVLSCCEMVGPKRPCPPMCSFLPLYPPVPRGLPFKG